MIPYFQFTSFHLGPLTIYVWGLLVALGLLIGGLVAARLARQRGLDEKILWDAISLAALAGVIGGRLFHVIFYQPAVYLADPVSIFALWDGGLSFTGSFLGAAGALFWFFRPKGRHGGLPLQVAMAYLDTLFFATPLAYGIGRLGCFLIHDHPGIATTFFLGVRWPDGIVRHDLGLDESLSGFALFAIFLVLHRKKVKPPTYFIAFLLWYGLSRFLLDFLRVGDARYFGLTPAQYLAVALFFVGVMWGSKKGWWHKGLTEGAK